MSEETFMIGSCSETLQVTSEGKYQLEIEGTIDHTFRKRLTEKQAKDWFQKRYPEYSWEECVEEANDWLKDQQKAA